MKALIYYGPKDIKLEEIPKPKAESNDVIVKIARAGICGSDITAYLHDGHCVAIFPKGENGADGQIGHEMVGTVSEVGADTTGIAVGDRVFINPTKCKRTGMLGCDTSGAFSEYVLVEDAAYGKNLLKLDDNVTFDQAVITEPLAVGTHGKNCVDVKPQEHVVVFGAGTIGLCTLNALLAAGCSKPVVVDLNTERLKIAESMGAVPYNPQTDGDMRTFLAEHFGTVKNMFTEDCVDVDAYIDCAGAPNIVNDICSFAKSDARISIVAVYKKPLSFHIGAFSERRLKIQGSCGYDMEDIIEALDHISAAKTKVGDIVTHHFPHDKIVEAFKLASDPSSGAIKVVIDYD